MDFEDAYKEVTEKYKLTEDNIRYLTWIECRAFARLVADKTAGFMDEGHPDWIAPFRKAYGRFVGIETSEEY